MLSSVGVKNGPKHPAADSARVSSYARQSTQIMLVPTTLLSVPPSVQCGKLSFEEELEQRHYGCEWIQKGSVLLGIRAEAMSNAQAIFHRFYYRRSMHEFDVKLVAGASLYLGCKLAETPRRVKDLIYVMTYLEWLEKKEAAIHALTHRIDHKKEDAYVEATSGLIQQLERELCFPAPGSAEYQQMKTYIHRVERHILRETGFCITQVLVHPHRFILQYIHSIFGSSPKEWRNAVSQRAWGYLNDAFRVPLCCKYQPAVITSAAIYLAAKDNGTELQRDWEWFKLFDTAWEDVLEVSSTILALYSSPCPRYCLLANPPVPSPVIVTANKDASPLPAPPCPAGNTPGETGVSQPRSGNPLTVCAATIVEDVQTHSTALPQACETADATMPNKDAGVDNLHGTLISPNPAQPKLELSP